MSTCDIELAHPANLANWPIIDGNLPRDPRLPSRHDATATASTSGLERPSAPRPAFATTTATTMAAALFLPPSPLLRNRPYLSPPIHPSPRRNTRPQLRAALRTFQPSDFEILRIVGQQSFATITDWEYYTPAPFAPTRTTEPSEPAIRLYDAKVIAPILDLYNARVLLKEFLPSALDLAVAEAEAYNHIYAAVPNSRNSLPIATLTGSFLTDASFDTPSFVSAWRSRFPRSPIPPAPDTPFLVFNWEGLKTGLTLAAPPPSKTEEPTWLQSIFYPNKTGDKSNYLRTFTSSSLSALSFLHSQAGLVHRSVGLASIMVNTVQWNQASFLDVKLRDLGFAKTVSALAQGAELERARRNEAFTPAEIAAFYFAEDIYALGYALLEVVFSVFSEQPVTQDTFKKLFEDTFSLGMDEIRQYCSQDPEWGDAVAFLDEKDRSGWKLLLSMLRAKQDFKTTSLSSLRESPFLK